MNLKQIYEKYALRFLYTFSLSAGFALYFNALLGSGLNGGVLFAAALLFTMFFTLFDLFEKSAVFYVVLMFGAAALLWVFLLAGIPVSEAFAWLLFSRSPEAERALTYSLISETVLLFTVVGAAFYLLNLRYVRFAAGGALAVFCVVMAVLESNAGFWEILLFFTFILCVLHEWLLSADSARRTSAPAREAKTKNFFKRGPIQFSALNHLLYFMLAAGLITACLPSKQEPIQWEAVKSVYRSVRDMAVSLGEQISLKFGGNTFEFGVSMTGYSDSGNIKGGVSLSDKEELRIRNYSYSGLNIYLTGTVMDNYTGRGWTRKNNFDEFILPEYKMDNLELRIALYNGGLLYDEEVCVKRDIEVRYLESNTRTLFYPLKAFNFNFGADLKRDCGGSSMFFGKPADEGDNYRVRYFDLNYNSDSLIHLLENSVYVKPEMTAGEIQRILKSELIVFGEIPDDYARHLEMRRDKIFSVYTELPDSVPERVYSLADDITSGFSGDYAKMHAIEGYLTHNYEYTLTPPAIPDGDFADAFLFEMKEGYCTYFASAAAVLGRAAGIPTRYVQGYSVKAESTYMYQSYAVKGSSAHAWTEAYIDGAGWIAFEPTPAFTGARYGGWLNQSEPAKNSEGYYVPYEKTDAYNTGEAYGKTEEEAANEHGGVYLTALAAGAFIILFAAIAVFTGIYVSMRRIQKQYGNLTPELKFLTDYKTILALFRFAETEPLCGETAGQFAVRLNDGEFLRITRVFERVRYGGTNVSPENVQEAADYKEKLLSRNEKGLKQSLGKMRYYLYLAGSRQ